MHNSHFLVFWSCCDTALRYLMRSCSNFQSQLNPSIPAFPTALNILWGIIWFFMEEESCILQVIMRSHSSMPYETYPTHSKLNLIHPGIPTANCFCVCATLFFTFATWLSLISPINPSRCSRSPHSPYYLAFSNRRESMSNGETLAINGPNVVSNPPAAKNECHPALWRAWGPFA